MTFNARFIANIIQFASQQGADKRILVSLTGVNDLEELSDPELRFDSYIYNKVLEKALELTGDPYFGLHVGEYLSLSAAGLIVQIVQSCRTVHEALNYIVDFANLGCSALPYQLKEQKNDWELFMTPNPLWVKQSPDSVRHTMDGAVVFTIREFHTLTRQKYYPQKIHFTYPRPKQFLEYERLFKCPVYFNQPTTSIFLNKKQVAEPVITSDFDLLRILVSHAEKKLLGLKKEHGFSTIVRQAIFNLVKPQFPTIEQVASNLNISVRTLQRRLKEEGLTYQGVIESLKHQLAIDYLKNKNLSIIEIAYLLDYSDGSSFNRAFKKWERTTPTEWRVSH